LNFNGQISKPAGSEVGKLRFNMMICMSGWLFAMKNQFTTLGINENLFKPAQEGSLSIFLVIAKS
jgi:hypothetical protein